jgi:23S rRNA (guanosine2251-2'-O)-methyltransferase
MSEWIYGRNPVFEVLGAGRRSISQLRIAQGTQLMGRLQDILNLCSQKNIPVNQVSREQLDGINPHHQGLALQVGAYPYASIPEIFARAEAKEQQLLILILDSLNDPQNLGTLLRTGEVVGVHGVLLPLRRTATVTPAVVNASSGASEHLLITQVNLAQAIKEIKQYGAWVVGLESSQGAQSIEQIDLDCPLALVVGSEGQGLRALVRESCDYLVRLPMRGQINSLNAAAAGSIVLYFAWRARGYH